MASARNDDGCCSVSVIKAILYAYQFVFLVTGVVICAIGTWKFLSTYHFFTVPELSAYAAVLYLFLITGGMVILAFIFGCCAIFNDHTKMMFSFILILVFVFLMQSLVAIMAYIYQQTIDEDVAQRLNSSMLAYYRQPFQKEKTASIDIIQHELRCCGAGSFSDWKYSKWLNSTTLVNKVPDSCCKTVSYFCGMRDHPSNIWTQGCLRNLTLNLQDSLWVICGVSLGLSVIQIVGVVYSIKLFLKLEATDRNKAQRANGSGNEPIFTTF